jgi:phosphate transport system substrate-binding protein
MPDDPGDVEGRLTTGMRQANEGPAQRVHIAIAHLGALPLTRSIYMFARVGSGGQLDPRVREFLLYVLSRQGQDEVTALSVYMPLTPSLVAQQRKQLK